MDKVVEVDHDQRAAPGRLFVAPAYLLPALILPVLILGLLRLDMAAFDDVLGKSFTFAEFRSTFSTR